MSNHPEESLLYTYLDGELEPGQRAELEAHLQSCRSCTKDLERLRRLFSSIEGLPEAGLTRDLAPAILKALSPLPRWVPSLAIGELLGALGILAAMVLGLGTSGILVGLSAASGRIVTQLEAASSQVSIGWDRALEWLGSLRSWSGIELPDLASAGMWATIAIAALLLWFVGNGLVLGRVRPKVSR